MNPQASNPNDFKVVSFHNNTDFGFTPDMGCMYDGRPINGKTGAPGIAAGETMTLPYHIGHQLALNLAKVALVRSAPSTDPAGIPTGVPLWDTTRLDALKNSYLKELYAEQKPTAMSQTDILMAKVEEYKRMVDDFVSAKEDEGEPIAPESTGPADFQDKQDVISELDRRGIKHDKRKGKAELEKLLV